MNWHWARRVVSGASGFLRTCVHRFARLGQACIETLRYYAALFLYTSRLFLRLEGYLALAVVLIYFTVLFLSVKPKGGDAILEAYYIIFTCGMILVAMNLLPRERGGRTLEILWSQPFSRGGIILVQVISLTVWCAVLMGLLHVLFSRFLAAEGYAFWVGIYSLSTAFSVGIITVFVSTFCRNAIATGIVAAVIFGIHYFWLTDLLPPITIELRGGHLERLGLISKDFEPFVVHVSLYFNPLPPATFARELNPHVPIREAILNRVFLLVGLGLVYDWLLLRLRRSSMWLT